MPNLLGGRDQEHRCETCGRNDCGEQSVNNDKSVNELDANLTALAEPESVELAWVHRTPDHQRCCLRGPGPPGWRSDNRQDRDHRVRPVHGERHDQPARSNTLTWRLIEWPNRVWQTDRGLGATAQFAASASADPEHDRTTR